MIKNPFVNALSAATYIFLVVAVMTLATKPLQNQPDTFFAPVMMLLVLTLSVAVMAFLFFYQPLQLLIEGKKKAAFSFFLQTVGIFAALTGVVLTTLYLGII